jgi:two-component system OmpR family response regulator
LDRPKTDALRILIVDDNQDAADSLACLLELYHYEVRVTYDGLHGLIVARTFAPACMLTDISMPRLDGYELARRVRAEPNLANVKLVALSAFTGEGYIRKVTEAGFDYHLTKGCDLDEVLEVLKMIEEIKNLAARTQELAKENVELAGQTKELIREVKEDVKEVKKEVKELKQEVKELKDEYKKTDGANGS